MSDVIIEDPTRVKYEGLRIAQTPAGLGVFATRDFPKDAIIGEIKGEMIEDWDYESDYCLWLGDQWHLEPEAPFRFLNHHCEANCDFDVFEEELENGKILESVCVFATRSIRQGEQLTLDYQWPADSAIPCLCGSPRCRGWVVCPTELPFLLENLEPDTEEA